MNMRARMFGPAGVQFGLLVLLVVVSITSLTLGRFDVTPRLAARIILSTVLPITPDWTPQMETVILDVRLPRILAAILVGAGLALSGASFQGLFRNPLVSPHLLGVASGAGFGAALAMLFGATFFTTEVVAFVFGLVAVALPTRSAARTGPRPSSCSCWRALSSGRSSRRSRR